MRTFENAVLTASGLALFYVSTMRLIDPTAAAFLSTYLSGTGNTLTTEMASEIRGIGAEMVLSGIVAFLGILVPRFRLTAFAVLSILFAGIALGRAVSWIVDGVPDPVLFMPWAIEAILALMNVLCLSQILSAERVGRADE